MDQIALHFCQPFGEFRGRFRLLNLSEPPFPLRTESTYPVPLGNNHMAEAVKCSCGVLLHIVGGRTF